MSHGFVWLVEALGRKLDPHWVMVHEKAMNNRSSWRARDWRVELHPRSVGFLIQVYIDSGNRGTHYFYCAGSLAWAKRRGRQIYQRMDAANRLKGVSEEI